jgi:hypothetical protein
MVRLVAIALLVWVVAVMTMVLVLSAVTAARVRARNRVVPDTPTLAPLHWLWSPTAAARLHRQLRDVATPLHVPAPPTGRRARAAAAPPAPTVELRRSLCLEATRLDAHLASSRRAARPVRRATMQGVATEVTELQHLAQRIRHLETQAASLGGHTPGQPTGLAPIAAHLELLEAAHGELDAIERATGLGPIGALPTDTSGHLAEITEQQSTTFDRRAG